MRKKKTGYFVWVLLIWLFCEGGRAAPLVRAAEYCKIGSALKYTAGQIGLEPVKEGYQGYRAALEQAGILREGELNDYQGGDRPLGVPADGLSGGRGG